MGRIAGIVNGLRIIGEVDDNNGSNISSMYCLDTQSYCFFCLHEKPDKIPDVDDPQRYESIAAIIQYLKIDLEEVLLIFGVRTPPQLQPMFRNSVPDVLVELCGDCADSTRKFAMVLKSHGLNFADKEASAVVFLKKLWGKILKAEDNQQEVERIRELVHYRTKRSGGLEHLNFFEILKNEVMQKCSEIKIIRPDMKIEEPAGFKLSRDHNYHEPYDHQETISEEDSDSMVVPDEGDDYKREKMDEDKWENSKPISIEVPINIIRPPQQSLNSEQSSIRISSVRSLADNLNQIPIFQSIPVLPTQPQQTLQPPILKKTKTKKKSTGFRAIQPQPQKQPEVLFMLHPLAPSSFTTITPPMSMSSSASAPSYSGSLSSASSISEPSPPSSQEVPDNCEDPNEDILKKSYRYNATECPICNKTYSGAAAVRKHIAGVHHKIRPFKCTICEDKTYTQSAHLDYHIQTFHNGVRRFPCTICGKILKGKTQLRIHRKQCKIIHNIQEGEIRQGQGQTSSASSIASLSPAASPLPLSSQPVKKLKKKATKKKNQNNAVNTNVIVN